MGKVRHWELNAITRCHTASKEQSRDWNLSNLAPEPMFHTTTSRRSVTKCWSWVTGLEWGMGLKNSNRPHVIGECCSRAFRVAEVCPAPHCTVHLSNKTSFLVRTSPSFASCPQQQVTWMTEHRLSTFNSNILWTELFVESNVKISPFQSLDSIKTCFSVS